MDCILPTLSFVPPEPTICFAPKYDMPRMVMCMQNCISGALKASIFSARVKSFFSS